MERMVRILTGEEPFGFNVSRERSRTILTEPKKEKENNVQFYLKKKDVSMTKMPHLKMIIKYH